MKQEGDKMFCKNCGAEIKNGAGFCPQCGTPVSQNTNPGGYQQPGGGRSFVSQFKNFHFGGGETAGGLSMQWYQFVTSLGIFGSAIIYVIFAIRTIMGSAYLDQTIGAIKKMAKTFGGYLGDLSGIKEEYSVGLVWEEVGALHAIDIIMIICWFGMVVAAILVRQQLVQYKKDAPKHFTIFIAAGGGLYFLHSLLRQIIYGGYMADGGLSGANFMVVPIIGLIIAVAVAYFNNVYFARRAAMFRN